MEKKSAATNEKDSNYIPNDLAFSILSKLPLKSLQRFGCIRKSWSLLFENSHFMTMYRNNFIGNTSLLLKQALPFVLGQEPHSRLYLLSGERFESRVKLDWPPPYQDYDGFIHVVGSSVNGVLCLLRGSRRVILWNPATGEFKVIPPSPVESESPYRDCMWDLSGFGYDHVRNDYKMIRYVRFCPETEDDEDYGTRDSTDISFDPLCEIYSLRSNSWRTLDLKLPSASFAHRNGARVYTDGVCHWWGDNEASVISCLVSFDLSNEVFFTTPIPSNMGDASFDVELLHLVVLNGSIAFIYNYAETTTFQIFMLGELGVKESWTKLFIVKPLTCVQHPIGMAKKGDIFFKKKDEELAWFDLSLQMIVELGLKAREWDCQIVTYNENLTSLLPIGLVD